MGRRELWASALALGLLLDGCPKTTQLSSDVKQDGGSSPGNSQAGSGTGNSTGRGGSGAGNPGGDGTAMLADGGSSSGSGGNGSGGSGSTADCGSAIPALCRVCNDGSCGTPVCQSGRWAWQCPEDGAGGRDAGTAPSECIVGGCSSELCTDKAAGPVASDCIYRPEFACYKNATCAAQAGGHCGWTMTPELTQCLANGATGGGGGSLRWFTSCGAPVCSSDPTPFDDPSIPNCTTQKLGDPCTTEGERCDGVASCGATYVCATMAPVTCPRSRARFKRDISYLDQQQLQQYHDELMSVPLASYRYKDAPAVPQLGFIIDDIEPSVAVAGDHVNMYGYLSMAVAAIKVQQQQIETLQRELDQLRGTRPGSEPVCGP